MAWTEQKIQILKDMWGHHSASEIAEIIGGLTRNAVIGKAHRLKLSIQRTTSSVSLSASRENISAPSKSSKKQRTARYSMGMPQVPASMKAMPVMKDVFRSLEGISGAEGNTEGVPMTKAGERHCRWPIGDPRSANFRFCGCISHEGLPYCSEHARIAYQNVGKRFRVN
ncbi:MAG: GcrA family cell cycle regulator [Alphaproteobacteria bacterium]|nr:GcrA family cell cycle regulator [Alphaproteobacteria bacterium]MCL2505070.1 GcrA family cell cycle regulator [Alphaproteobacteria bacterium]